MEGSMVNLDVTAPGATLALALMFLKACCAVAVNFSFFFFFLFVSLFSYSFWFCWNGYLQKAYCGDFSAISYMYTFRS
jgi:hypothetical protein